MRERAPADAPPVPDRYESLKCDSVDKASMTSGTTTVFGPMFPTAGHIWDSLLVVTPTNAVVATDTFAFDAFVLIDGVKQYLTNASVSTTAASTGTIVANRPYRCHEAERLDYQIPEGAVLGVDVTRTAGTLVTPSFKFLTRFGG